MQYKITKIGEKHVKGILAAYMRNTNTQKADRVRKRDLLRTLFWGNT